MEQVRFFFLEKYGFSRKISPQFRSLFVKTEKGVSSLDDSRIIGLFFERSERAIEETQRKYGRLLRHVAENILGREDAEECESDCYLRLWNAIPPERPTSLKAYCVTVTRRLALNRYHADTSRKRDNRYDLALSELESCLGGIESAETETEARELSAAINRFLGEQSREDRQIFVSRYYLSDSVGDIAAKTGLESGTVSVRLFRLREKLRNFLTKEGFTV